MRNLISTLSCALLAGVLVSCGTRSSEPGSKTSSLSADLERLELRLNQFEQRLKDLGGTPVDSDSKTPPGPLRSLTLRLGTDDDRLRLYWADGQASDLICSQEGEGIWACG